MLVGLILRDLIAGAVESSQCLFASPQSGQGKTANDQGVRSRTSRWVEIDHSIERRERPLRAP